MTDAGIVNVGRDVSDEVVSLLTTLGFDVSVDGDLSSGVISVTDVGRDGLLEVLRGLRSDDRAPSSGEEGRVLPLRP